MPSSLPASTRLASVIGAVLAVLASALLLGVPPVNAAAPEPQTYTITYQCDPNKPGYGTNSLDGAELPVRIGDTVRVVMDSYGCKEGSMHTRGDLGQFQTSPAWSGSCCRQQASGTVFEMRVVNFSDNRYGPGYTALAFFRINSSAMNPAVIRVQRPIPEVPAAPPITGTDPDERSAMVSFDVPFNGNSPITAYQWRIVSPTAQATDWTSIPPTAVMADVNGLKVGTKYTVELRAVNAVGPGLASTTSFATTSQPPGPPTNLVADPGDGVAVISFTPGPDGGSDIVGYQYRIDGGEWQDAGTDSSPVRVGGLENGRAYDIELRALTEIERSVASEPVGVEPNLAGVDLWVCHWDGKAYEAAWVVATPKGGVGEHGDHDRDIIPYIVGYYPGGKNWDNDDNFWTWVYGCATDEEVPDADEDGLDDLEDADDDGDGLPDDVDSDDDGDGIVDRDDDDFEFTTDSDDDGLPDAAESDDDGDGIADIIDGDADGDGVADVEDQDRPLPDDADNDGTPDALDADDDGDCLVDADDADRDGDLIADAVDPDLDNDGIPNDEDADIDGDGTVNGTDGDVNGDTVTDAEDAAADLGGPSDDGGEVRAKGDVTCDAGGAGAITPEGRPLRVRVDTDRDGIPNVQDTDDDGDGTPDVTDRDSDGDGVRDAVDGDANGDGQVETKDQPLVTAFALPAFAAGPNAFRVKGPLRTVAGQRATVRVDCAAAGSTRARTMVVPAGDVAAPRAADLCTIRKVGSATEVILAGQQPTRLTVRISAPAVGDYRALDEVLTAQVPAGG